MRVDYSAGQEWIRSVSKSLGGGGLFLAKWEGLEPGQEVSLRFRPAKHLPIMQAKASVRYVISGDGTAVEFTEISADNRQKILRLILQRTGDRRIQGRAPLATQVQCEECMELAFSRDISPGGMFIETTAGFPVGTYLTVRFNLDNMDRVVTATAQVTYHVEKLGMGVLFSEIEPNDRDAIQKYVEAGLLSALQESAGQSA
jgi:c-di-GMP-binding flagellar brake protein YcgR